MVLYVSTTNLQWYSMYLLQTYSGTLCIYYKPTVVLYQQYYVGTSNRGVGGDTPVLEFCIYILWNFERVWATPLYPIKTSNIFETFGRWLQATFSSAFSLKKNVLFWCRFHEVYNKRSKWRITTFVSLALARYSSILSTPGSFRIYWANHTITLLP